MAVNYDLQQTGEEVQELLNQIIPNKEAIANEKSRAEGVEQKLQESIDNEKSRAEGAEQHLQESIDNEKSRAEGVEQQLQESIDGINELIPGQASADNQLADKDFVNSSIATSTAEFKGTYDSLEELQEVEADTNDYGFVHKTDSEGNTVYERYKYIEGSGWKFEYNLNNSSFTASQWEAINSAITSGDVKKLRDIMTRGESDQKFTEITETLKKKAYKSTTLEGYGITDVKIEDGVITIGNETIIPMTAHQKIYELIFSDGKFSEKNYTPNLSSQTINIPTKISHLINDSDFLTSHQDISGKADRSTTLEGYGITDAKIENGVITLGENTITPITSLAGYLTETEINRKISEAKSDIIGGAPQTYDTLKEIADYIESHKSVEQALNAAIGNKADRASTLAGYGITDAKIANGIITLGGNTITPATKDDLNKYLPLSGGTLTGKLSFYYDNNDGNKATINMYQKYSNLSPEFHIDGDYDYLYLGKAIYINSDNEFMGVQGIYCDAFSAAWDGNVTIKNLVNSQAKTYLKFSPQIDGGFKLIAGSNDATNDFSIEAQEGNLSLKSLGGDVNINGCLFDEDGNFTAYKDIYLKSYNAIIFSNGSSIERDFETENLIIYAIRNQKVATSHKPDIEINNTSIYGSGRIFLRVKSDGYVYISGVRVDYDGSLTAKTLTQTSDENLKDNITSLDLSIDSIAKAPSIAFDWKDGSGTGFGSIAQYWGKIVPQAVSMDKETGTLSMQYGNLALVSVINVAKEVVNLRSRIEKLESVA